ncbi:hypothetical protein CR513_53935, partial [Mucuna pruriens]
MSFVLCSFLERTNLVVPFIKDEMKRVGTIKIDFMNFFEEYGRVCQISNEVLIANELIDEAKRENNDTLLFNVDLEKAYNSVN